MADMSFRVDTPKRRQEFRNFIDTVKDPKTKQYYEELYQEQLKVFEAEHSENVSEGKLAANEFKRKVKAQEEKTSGASKSGSKAGSRSSSGFTEIPKERSLVPAGKAQSRNDREAFRRKEKNEKAIDSAKAQDERHVQVMERLKKTLIKRYAEQPRDEAQIRSLESEINRQYKFHTQMREEIQRLGGTPNKSVDTRARGILSWMAAQGASAQKQSNRASERRQRASERQAEQNRKASEREGKAQARETRREQRHEKDRQFHAEHQSKEREKDRAARAAEAERNRQFRATQAEGTAASRTREREEDFVRRQSLNEDRAALESFRAEEARQRHAERVEFARMNEGYRRRRERRRMVRAAASATAGAAADATKAGMKASRRQKKEQAESRARKRPTRIGSRIGDGKSTDMTVPILVVGGSVLAFMLLVGGTK